MSLESGTQLGRYEIRSRLGAGGMGEVYLARDTSELERTVALKFLPAELASDQKRLQRFIQEAKTVSALNHPNILTIYEFGQAESVRFIAMEYVDGVTLREEMRAHRLKLHDVLDIAIQIAAALNAAHEAGVVHRDIKPENIMVRRDHIVKVLDFGLAKLTMKSAAEERASVDSQAGTRVLIHTEPGLVMGTASYMSPEQSQDSARADHRTDIWSLGVVLYEMVAGRVPFEGKDIHRQIIAIQETDPPPLSRFTEGVPERLEEIILKALAKSADERYQTAKDLLIDLRNLKRKLDVDAEIERTFAPELRSATGAASGAQATHQSAGQSVGQTASVGDAQPTSPTSGAPASASQSMWQKRGIQLIAFAVVFTAAALAIYFYFAKHNAQPTVSSTVEPIDSIAILPLMNESHDPTVDWLADGLTESIIYKLSQLPNLRVMARSTVFRYKGKDVDPAQVARELNVRAILTGRVLQHGDDLSVSAELIDARDNRLIWGERYDRKMTDLNAVQQEIALVVSEKLRQKLTGAEQKQLAKGNTENTEAYQLYLKGRYYRNRFTLDGYRQAIDMFNQAISLDPNYALAYAGLADTYYWSSTVLLPAPEAMAKAKEVAQRALELDDQLAEAHLSLGLVRFLYDWQFAEAEQQFKHAIELNSNLAEAHFWYSQYLAEMGRFDEAITEAKLAQQLDPLSSLTSTQVGFPLFLSGRYDESIAANLRGIELNPNAMVIHYNLSVTYSVRGDCAKGIDEAQRALQLVDEPDVRTILAYGYACANNRAAAEQTLTQALNDPQKTPPSPYNVALVYLALHDKEQAFAWLEKAYQERSEYMTWLKTDPRLNSLRSDPRFQDLQRRVGLPQ